MPAEVEFVTVPDLHIGFGGNIFPDQNADALIYEAVDQVIEYARENGIKYFVFLGDIFEDPDPTQEQINRFLQLLVVLSEFFIIHIIPGNHDFSFIGKNSLETIAFVSGIFKLENVYLHMQPTRKILGGVPFCFMPWPHHNKSKAGLKLTPSVNIAHVAQHGAIADTGNVIRTGGVKLDTDTDAWVLGHLHRKQNTKRVFYPGTLYQKSFGEPIGKGIGHYTARLRDGMIHLKEKWVPIQSPFELFNLRIEKPEDLKLVLPQVEKRPVLRYKLFIKNDVALPPYFLTNNPHVVKHEGWRNKAELESIERGTLDIISMPPLTLDHIVYSDLSPLLKQYGLKKPERIKGKRIVETIVARLTAQAGKSADTGD